MTAEELMKPRFELIADYPSNQTAIGTVLECPTFDSEYWIELIERYPHLFRKLNWWEYRKIEDMPKKLICKAIPGDTSINEIEEWDMDILVGWTNKKDRVCCSLLSFNPEYGYFPID